ncbi:MAG: hypothetical protein RLZZ175_1474 [Bacteroidota bacterium]|jgi:hypothetical protein
MKNLLYIIFIILFTGCLRLDDNLFNNSKLSSYKLDNYDGYLNFRVDNSFAINDTMIHIFTLDSKAANESSSTKIYAIYIGDVRKIKTDTVIMYCHGNRDHMDFYWQRAKLLANSKGKNRFGILMIDYRGYGMSEGKPSEEGLYADVDAALLWLKNQGLSNDRLIMYGYSMGSAPATKMCADEYSMKPSKLILESPFASAETMVQDGTGLAMPGEFFTSLKIKNAEKIKEVTVPFCWLHGIDDEFLNINTHGEVVYGHYQASYKEAHRVAGADHVTVPLQLGFTNYCDILGDFILEK